MDGHVMDFMVGVIVIMLLWTALCVPFIWLILQ